MKKKRFLWKRRPRGTIRSLSRKACPMGQENSRFENLDPYQGREDTFKIVVGNVIEPGARGHSGNKRGGGRWQ